MVRLPMSYDGLCGQILPGFSAQEFECFEVGEEAVIADVHPGPVQLQDSP